MPFELNSLALFVYPSVMLGLIGKFRRPQSFWILVYDLVSFLLLLRIMLEALLRPGTEGSTSKLFILGSGVFLWKLTSVWTEQRDFKTVRSIGTLLLYLLFGAGIGVAVSTPALFSGWGSPGDHRIVGIWNDANLFGAHMAISFVAGFGIFFQSHFDPEGKTRRHGIHNIVSTAGLIITALACLRSYSRGACLSSLLAVTFIVWYTIYFHRFSHSQQRKSGRFSKWISRTISFILMSVVVILLGSRVHQGELGYLEPWISRSLSSLDPMDSSWVNRISAWIGCVDIMLANLIDGVGLDGVVPLYAEGYKPPGVFAEGAIATNDFAFIGAGLGMPTFLMIVASPLLVLAWFTPRFGIRAVYPTVTLCGLIICCLVSQTLNGTVFSWSLGCTFWIVLGLVEGAILRQFRAANTEQIPMLALFRTTLLPILGIISLALVLIFGVPRADVSGNLRETMDGISVMRLRSRSAGNALAIILDASQDDRRGYGGLRYLADRGFTTFSFYPRSNSYKAATDWVRSVELAIDWSANEQSSTALVVLFGAKSASLSGQILRLLHSRRIVLCWFGIDWRSDASADLLSYLSAEAGRLPSSIVSSTEVVFFTDDLKSMLTHDINLLNLQKRGLHWSFKLSAVSDSERLRPFALREACAIAKKVNTPSYNVRERDHWREQFLEVIPFFVVGCFIAIAGFLLYSYYWYSAGTESMRNFAFNVVLLTAVLAVAGIQCARGSYTRMNEFTYEELNRCISEVSLLGCSGDLYSRNSLVYLRTLHRRFGLFCDSLDAELFARYVVSPDETIRYEDEILFRRELWKAYGGALKDIRDAVIVSRVAREQILNSTEVNGTSLQVDRAWRVRAVPVALLIQLQVSLLRTAGVPTRIDRGAVQIWYQGRWLSVPPLI